MDDNLCQKYEERLAVMEEKISNICEDIEKMKGGITSLFEWAEAVYEHETNFHDVFVIRKLVHENVKREDA